jgi:hypothetical protein
MNPGSLASPRDSAVKRLQEATRLRRRVGTLIIGSTVLPQIGPENGLSRVGIDVEGAINSGQSTRSEEFRCLSGVCAVVRRPFGVHVSFTDPGDD